MDLDKIINAEGFEKTKFQEEFARAIVQFQELNDQANNAADSVLINDDKKKEFQAHARTVNQLYKAILPDPKAGEFLPERSALKAISDLIKRLVPSGEDDIEEIRKEIEQRLDQSIVSSPVILDDGAEPIDISTIDFEKLKERFAKKKNKRVEIQKLKTQIEQTVEQMIEQNRSRIDFKEQFEEMIEKYNNHSVTAELQFEELFEFVKKLNREQERHIRESLSEEELAMLDIITQNEKVELTQKERTTVKNGIQKLLEKLMTKKLVHDWSNYQTRISDVKVTIDTELDGFLPDKYDRALYVQTCSEVFDHVMQKY